MTAQTIRTPAGEELVILPRAEYDALISRLEELEEDAADIAAYDAAKAAMGGEPVRVIPADELKGALIRHRRKARGLTQDALAAAAGVQQGFISDLESGRRRGSPETLDKIADALRLSAAEIEALRS